MKEEIGLGAEEIQFVASIDEELKYEKNALYGIPFIMRIERRRCALNILEGRGCDGFSFTGQILI